jgi:hypothetical protein
VELAASAAGRRVYLCCGRLWWQWLLRNWRMAASPGPRTSRFQEAALAVHPALATDGRRRRKPPRCAARATSRRQHRHAAGCPRVAWGPATTTASPSPLPTALVLGVGGDLRRDPRVATGKRSRGLRGRCGGGGGTGARGGGGVAPRGHRRASCRDGKEWRRSAARTALHKRVRRLRRVQQLGWQLPQQND